MTPNSCLYYLGYLNLGIFILANLDLDYWFRIFRMAKSKVKTLERLDRCVSHITGLSRSQAMKLIRAGEVMVNGEVILDSSTKVPLDAVLNIEGYDDVAGSGFEHRVFILNKPNGYVCADQDKQHNTIFSLFKNELKPEKLHCAGRLDLDTLGLLVVSDDGDLIHEITSPKKEVDKVYLARVAQKIPVNAVQKFASGLKHPEEKKRYLPAKLTILSNEDNLSNPLKIDSSLVDHGYLACVQLHEGRYHEVKRLFELVGCEVIYLVRIAIGKVNFSDINLKLGEYGSATDCLDDLFENHDYTEEELRQSAKAFYDLLATSGAHFYPSFYVNNLSQIVNAKDNQEEAIAIEQEEVLDDFALFDDIYGSSSDR